MTEIYYLCKFDDVPENGARSFTVDTSRHPLDIFLTKKDGNVYGYLNSCPHMQVNLNWKPDKFHDYTGEFLQCTFHGAIFRIEDGYCTHGPCAGQSLQPLTIRNQDGELSLELGH